MAKSIPHLLRRGDLRTLCDPKPLRPALENKTELLVMRNSLEIEISKLLVKLRASGHAIDLDALAHSILDEHREIGLQVIKDRIRTHVNRLRCKLQPRCRRVGLDHHNPASAALAALFYQLSADPMTAKWQAKQVGALSWRKRRGRLEILLVTSRETSRWVIPKGGVMDHLTDMNAARQEAFEEAGIAGHMTRKVLGTYSYTKPAAKAVMVRYAVKVFALEVERELKNWPEMRQRKRRWFSIEEAADKVIEPGLRRIIRAWGRTNQKTLSGPP